MGVKSLIDIVRRLRKNSTDTERYLWKYLRNRQIEGAKFRRQQQLGKYIVDFVNHENKVVIEVDGGQHADNSSDKIPLTLSLSHKGRGKIIFDNTCEPKRR